MNKKFFAALTSAAMLLSSTGVVAFAEEFDDEAVTTEASGNLNGATTPEPDNTNKVVLKEAFPNEDLRAVVKKDVAAANGIEEKGTYTKDQMAKLGTLAVPAGVKDLTGIETLTGLKTFTSDKGGYTTLDLSANTKLTDIEVYNNPALSNVNLPETDTLISLTMTGNGALTSIDLSKNIKLTNVDLSANSLGALDVSGNPYLEKLVVNNNSLNTLDATRNLSLTIVNAAANGLYEAKLPSSVVTVYLNDNKMKSFDGSNLTNATTLDVNNNMLESLKVAKNAYVKLDASDNHLATLDLKGASKAANGTIALDNQILYANTTDTAANLKEYDENFVKKSATSIANGKINSDGIFSFDKKATGNPAYTWNTGAAADMRVTVVKAVLMNRLYNPNSGEHFYTKDINEKDTLVSLGWQDEGIGWVAPETGAPVYRLYNPNAGDHHYTMSANEKDTLVSIGWKYEGIGWDSAVAASVVSPIYGMVEVYREYNPNAKAAGAHNYTISEVENDALVSLGWIDEGEAWSALK